MLQTGLTADARLFVLPLTVYASRGVEGGGSTLMHTNGYKGGGGSEHDQKYGFCMQFY